MRINKIHPGFVFYTEIHKLREFLNACALQGGAEQMAFHIKCKQNQTSFLLSYDWFLFYRLMILTWLSFLVCAISWCIRHQRERSYKLQLICLVHLLFTYFLLLPISVFSKIFLGNCYHGFPLWSSGNRKLLFIWSLDNCLPWCCLCLSRAHVLVLAFK